MGLCNEYGPLWKLPNHHETAHKRRSQPGSRRAVVPILLFVIALFALRYVVEVKISVRWRTPRMQQQYGSATHCKNTCFKARDGICDEGRPHRDPARQQHQEQQQRQQGMPAGTSAVHCDLGTDCSDCGPWLGRQADKAWSEPHLPIEFLRSHNVSVRSRVTSEPAAPLDLSFAFTDPALDWDVSKHIQNEGLLEVGISQIFYTLLSGRCSPSGPGGLVADVGANFGWFALLAARLGCRVIAWEPVPQFRALFSHNLARNQLAHLVDIRPTAVAHPAGSKQVVVVVPNRGIWGTAGIGGANVDMHVLDNADSAVQKVEVIAESLDEVLAGKHIDLLKVDVEGYEPSVLSTGRQLLAAGSVANVVLEYSPGVAERAARWSETRVYPSMLLDLLAANYTLLHLPDDFTRVWFDGRSVTGAIPQLKQILPDNLQYDLWDAKVFRTGWLESGAATPFCPAMVDLHLDNQGIPERLHPKSLHSAFGHNTNVWASRETKVISAFTGPPVGLFPLNLSMTSSWFPPYGTPDALGGIACSDLAEDMVRQLPGKSEEEVDVMMTVLIGRRCRCSHNLPCQEHAAAADACAKAGQTPYVDL